MAKEHLDEMETVEEGMNVNCNAGRVKVDQQGVVRGSDVKVWYMEKGIANIFSMNKLEKIYRITYDSWDGYYIVHTKKGPVHFNKDEHGLPYIDLNESNEVASTGDDWESKRKRFQGNDLASVRGKTVRSKPERVVESYVAIPREFMLSNRVVTLAADVFFVDNIPFLLTVSRKIKFVTAEHTPVKTAKQLTKHLKRVLNVYYRAGFKVRYVLMDGEFEKIKAELPEIVCNTTAAKEHVSEAERMIRVAKERNRGLVNTLPFTHIPKRMKIEFIYFTVLWLNAFPARSGISTIYSPREMLVRWKMDCKKHCRILPGSYAERAAAALDTAGIQMEEQLQAARTTNQVEAEPHELVYEVEIDMPPNAVMAAEGVQARIDDDGDDSPAVVELDAPDDGLVETETENAGDANPPGVAAEPIAATAPTIAPLPDIAGQAAGRYPSRSRRSVLGNQPYDIYSPQIQMLQAGSCEAQLLKLAQSRARRSVVGNGTNEQVENGYVNLMENHLEK
ncbi:hypothetical protein ACHAXR_006172, partial [Thalassiosira sp. AJA248-18]